MSSVYRLVKNSSVLFISSLFQRLMGLIVIVILARYLGAEVFGRYSFIIVFALMVDTIMCYGIDVLMIREIARNQSNGNNIFKNTLSFKIILIPVSIAVTFGALQFINLTEQMKYLILLLVFFQIFYGLNKTFCSFFSAYEQLEYVALIDIIFSALKTLLILTAVLLDLKLKYIVFGISSSYFAVFFVAIIIYHYKFYSISFEMDWKWLKENFNNSIWFILFVIISGYYWKIDQLIITKILHYEKTGIYSAAFMFIDLSIAISLPYFTSVYPLISRTYLQNTNNYKLLLDKSYKYLIMISFPLPFMGLFIMDEVIQLVFGPFFSEAAYIGKIFLFAIPFILIQSFMLRTVFSARKEKSIFLVTALIIIVKVLLNYLLLETFGIMAAAFIMILVEILYTYLTVVFCAPSLDFDFRKIISYASKPFAATCIMVGGLYFTRHFGVFWSIPFGLILYLSGLLIVKAIDNEEWFLLSKSLKRLLVSQN